MPALPRWLTPRWVTLSAILLLMTLLALASVAVGTVRGPFPRVSGEISVSGLSASVEVRRDQFGVPHLYADQAEDLFWAQGYVHAQDRFFEMDVRRRVTAGRLAEVFGAAQVETDVFVRTLGWRRVAERELPSLSPSTRRYLDAYAAGVNGYLDEAGPGNLALEYSLLGLQGRSVTPEEWTAVDSLAWLKAMAWDLGHNLDQESERAAVERAVGATRASDLYPDYPLGDAAPIVRRGDVRAGAFDASARAENRRPAPLTGGRAETADALASVERSTAALRGWLGPSSRGADTGSNSVVVAGSRTATGRAILANDPHLELSIPAIFTQVGLHCRTVSAACPFDVTGFSFAGMPGVVIGRNTSIAWGFTTSYADVQDLYVEQLRGNTARVGNAYRPLRVRTESVAVAGEDQPRTVTIRESRHGPLLSDVDPQVRGVAEAGPTGGAADQGTAYGVALRWVALDPGRTMDAIFGLNAAGTFADLRRAASLLSAPSQNITYADVRGNIGYQLPGWIPRRGRGDGVTPSPGWDPAYDWRGLIPFAELPYLYNPPEGFIVSANQPVIGRQYPYPLGSSFSYGWRSEELTETLDRAGKLTLDDAEQLFYDDTVRFAAVLVPRLLRTRVPDPWVAEGQRTLVGWDYSASPDSAAAAYFTVVLHDLLKRTFRDELPPELWPTGGDRWMAVLSQMLQDDDNPWWDDTSTEEVEDRDDIVVAAMTDARKELTSLMARDTDEWSWGRLHRVTLRHQTLGSSGIAPVERLFNRGDYPVGGGPAVVNAMGYDTTRGYRVTTGPTMRMLVDLGNLDGSRWVSSSGVSGHAFHRNYDDQTELWATNRTWPFVSTRAAVEASTVDVLTLVPTG